MPEAVAVAALSLLGTLLGSLGGVIASSKLTNFRLEQLERKVQAHNNLIERTFQLEAAQAIAEQRLDRLAGLRFPTCRPGRRKEVSMESFGIASVAGITVICYLMGLIVKNLPLNNKWIPSLAGLLGGILGLVGWRFMPDFPAGDVLTALAVGIVSGLAATGVHEAGCQLTREKS